MMEWSPKDAMKAYLDTLHMCKANNIHDDDEAHRYGLDGSKIIEPQGLELLSALAAGNQATTLLDISTRRRRRRRRHQHHHHHPTSVTPLTLALAVAAKQTDGTLFSIRPSHCHWYYNNNNTTNNYNYYYSYNNDDVIKLRVGDPCELINEIENVDFAVIDCTNLDCNHLRLLCEKLHLNPKGAIIVANNMLHKQQGIALVDQLLKGKKGVVQSSVTTLPLGSSSSSSFSGFQLIFKIKFLMANNNIANSQRRNNINTRFFVTC